MYVCVGVYARACVRVSVCMCAFVHKCASAYTPVFMGVQACVRLHACLLTCMFACMYVRASGNVRVYMRTSSGAHVHILCECVCE